MSQPVEIRRLGAADGALLDRVAPEVFDEPLRPDRLAAYLAEPTHLMIVAIAGGEVVGQTAAVLHRHPDKCAELYVDEVGVTPALQRQGIARRMMQAMFDWGREVGCDHGWLATETANVPARALYEALGAPAQPIVLFEYEFATKGEYE